MELGIRDISPRISKEILRLNMTVAISKILRQNIWGKKITLTL